MSLYRLFFVLILPISLLFVSCGGGGGGGNDTLPSDNNGGGSSGFSIKYTHTQNLNGGSLIDDANWFFDWFVENSDGRVRGPFESNASGVVNLGADSRMRANVTLKLFPNFYYTYVGMPVGQQRYFTGNRTADLMNQSVTVRNQASGQVSLGTDLLFWEDVTSNPFTLETKQYYPFSLMSHDDLVSTFVNYRSSEEEEPLTRYAFLLDQPLASFGNPEVDLSTPHTRVERRWQSDKFIGTTGPCLMADYRGQWFYNIGGHTYNFDFSGTFGLPEQLPADHWYLADKCDFTRIIARFSPDDEMIELRSPDRYIVADSLIFNNLQRKVSFTLNSKSGTDGTDTFEYGEIQLSNPPIAWTVYFPWSMVSVEGTAEGTAVNVPLPALPGYESLPAFTYASIRLYRIDDGGTADDMLQYELNPKENVHRAWALVSYHNTL